MKTEPEYLTTEILNKTPKYYITQFRIVFTGTSAGRMMFDWLMQHTDGFCSPKRLNIFSGKYHIWLAYNLQVESVWQVYA